MGWICIFAFTLHPLKMMCRNKKINKLISVGRYFWKQLHPRCETLWYCNIDVQDQIWMQIYYQLDILSRIFRLNFFSIFLLHTLMLSLKHCKVWCSQPLLLCNVKFWCISMAPISFVDWLCIMNSGRAAISLGLPAVPLSSPNHVWSLVIPSLKHPDFVTLQGKYSQV